MLEEKGRRLLVKAALIEIALGQQPGLFGETYPFDFSETAVTGLRRHKYPFGPLIKLVNAAGLKPSATDDFFLSLQNLSIERLKQKFGEARAQAEELVTQIQTHRAKYVGAPSEVTFSVEEALYGLE